MFVSILSFLFRFYTDIVRNRLALEKSYQVIIDFISNQRRRQYAAFYFCYLYYLFILFIYYIFIYAFIFFIYTYLCLVVF